MTQTIEKLPKSLSVRFVAIGCATFLVEYIVFYILYVFLHWNLLLANSLSFAVGLSMSFGFNRTWAFKKNNYHHKVHHQALIYVILALTNLIANNIIVGGLKIVSIDPRIGKILAIGIIAIWNFIIYKHIIFKEKTSTPIR